MPVVALVDARTRERGERGLLCQVVLSMLVEVCHTPLAQKWGCPGKHLGWLLEVGNGLGAGVDSEVIGLFKLKVWEF